MSPENKNIAPNTTAESDLRTASQRATNERWESTHQNIAYLVTFSAVGVASYLSVTGKGGDAPFMLLTNFATYIVTSYFTRTNNTHTAGVKLGDQGR